jgi:uncharacterized protein (DUF1697 family)
VTSYLALLKGINVGPHNRIAMADLRRLLTDLGHEDVSTYLQSGNALFMSAHADEDALAAGIEKAIASELDKTIRVLVRTKPEIRRILDADPLHDVATDPSKYLVTFLTHETGPLEDVDAAAYEPEAMALGRREVYNWYPNGVHKGKLNPGFFEKRLGKGSAATGRNWNTLQKLLELMP